MMGMILSLVGGMIFSVGLVISGMINPDKILGFLDVFGKWDYSLAFVMGGAVIFNLISFRIVTQRKPLFNTKHFLPSTLIIDKKLVIGSALFGIGWGILGICPGPGIVNLITLNTTAFLFVGSMSLGMIIFTYTERFWSK
jgi:uncharacterized protein